MVEHSSANQKFWAQSHTGFMDFDEACFMHLTPGVVHNCGCRGFLSPMHKKIPDSYSKREGDNPGNSGLLSQQSPSFMGLTCSIHQLQYDNGITLKIIFDESKNHTLPMN